VWSFVAIVSLRASSAPAVAGAGMLHGLAMWERSTFVGLCLVTVVSIARGAARTAASRWAVYLLGVTLAVGPWLARSVAVDGDMTLAATGAELLWRGNNPVASGGAFARGHPGVSVLDMAPEGFRARISAADEQGQRRLFASAARDFMTERPGEAARLFLRKLVAFWWFLPEAGAYYPRSYLTYYTWYYAAMLVLAGAGFVSAWRGAPGGRKGAIVAAGLLLSVALVHAVFYVEVRHRWGIEPVLLTFSAGGVMWGLSRVRSASRRAKD
jgi:hypothetical protein